MSTLDASRPVFTILSALVEDWAGLHYGPSEQDIFLEKVTARAEEAGFESLLDYYYYLRYDESGGAEIEKLIDALVVNETYFFRELQPLRVLVERLVAPRVAAGFRPRIWCAASATGEEPLTLAMLLAQAGLLERVELVASDISTRALDRARSGRFSRRSLREVPDPELARRFLHEDGDCVSAAAGLAEAIVWKQINLCAPSALTVVGPCDFILCRNVLIYFSDETAVRVIRQLTQLLNPHGALFVGVSESLLRFGTSLACEEVEQVFLYRKVS